jgi:transcription elongation GreA/GreB family factor
VTDLATQNAEVFTVLGAWDSDPDKGVISYLTPVAQSLLGHKTGDEIEIDMDGVPRRLRIDSIAAFKTA